MYHYRQKMFQVVIFCIMAISYCQCVDNQQYTTKYDSMDIEDVLKNERLLQNYVKCLLDEGPCTPDGAELKKVMTDALETDCEKCSEKQRANSDKVVQYLITERPEVWALLDSRYDPNGVYKNKYSDRLSSITTTEASEK